MLGIDLTKPIIYQHASLRYFKPGEHHIDRFCTDDVLLLVFDGVLRFTEDGEACAVGAGEYYIQRHDTVQTGETESDVPRYLYVHFYADWTEYAALPRRGRFDVAALWPQMEALDRTAHAQTNYLAPAAQFFAILEALLPQSDAPTLADRTAAYLNEHFKTAVTLENLCEVFHFSKNHVVNSFKARFGVTPIAYVNGLRLRYAEHLLEATSESTEAVAEAAGFRQYSHFYRLFCRKNGMAPAAWRAQKRIRP